MTVVRYLPVMGTHGWSFGMKTGRWWCGDSPFAEMMIEHGLVVLCRTRPFVWTTDLNGHHFWELRKKARGDHRDWAAGGENLFTYCVPPLEPYAAIPPVQVNIVCHSHGLNVVLYAAALGLKINRLISVASPVRDDMTEVAKMARPNITLWRHLHSDASDRTQWLGELFDGVINVAGARAHPLADVNELIPGVGHSRLLEDPACLPMWHERGWTTFLRSE